MGKHKNIVLPTKEDTLAKAIATLRRRKVTALKVELEANTGRPMGRHHNHLAQYLEHLPTVADYDFSDAMDDAGYDDGYDYDESYPYAETTWPTDYISYIRLYNDGSVDTEITMTIPLYTRDGRPSNEGVERLPELLTAFKDTFQPLQNVFNVSNAGLHIAALFSSDFSYPSEADNYMRRTHPHSRRLHSRKLKNFKLAMTELLPALYFLGAPDSKTRQLQFRRPNISVDILRDRETSMGYYDNPKYSAISYRDGALEYRLFDTCYETPERIHDYVMVIANTMKFLSMKAVPTGISELFDSNGGRLEFGNNNGDELERFYGASTRHIDALNKGLYLIKPACYSYRDLKEQRGFKLTKRKLGQAEKDIERRATKRYASYKKAHELTHKAQKQYAFYDRLYARLYALYDRTSHSTEYIAVDDEVIDRITNEVESEAQNWRTLEAPMSLEDYTMLAKQEFKHKYDTDYMIRLG